MSGRFTLAGLLMGVALVALVLAIVVPAVRYARRTETHADSVASVAASADGSTFAALMGDGRVLIWDKEGSLKDSLQTQASFGNELAMSFDGRLLSVSPDQILDVSTRSVWRALPKSVTAIVFSPTSERCAVINHVRAAPPPEGWHPPVQSVGPRYQVCTWDGSGTTHAVAAGSAACFSPDGKRLAVVNEDSDWRGSTHIGIYDFASGEKQQSLGTHPGRLPAYTCLTWGPDGEGLAAVFSSRDRDGLPEYTVAKLDLAGRWGARALVRNQENAVPPGGYYTLTHLPHERGLLVGAPSRGFTAYAPDTLLPVANADLSKVWYVAAGCARRHVHRGRIARRRPLGRGYAASTSAAIRRGSATGPPVSGGRSCDLDCRSRAAPPRKDRAIGAIGSKRPLAPCAERRIELKHCGGRHRKMAVTFGSRIPFRLWSNRST